MRKYKYIIVLLATLFALSACEREPLHIHGSIANLPDGTVYLRAYEGAWQPLDSTGTRSGEFEFIVPKILPNVLYVIFEGYPGYFIPVIIDGNEVSISGDIDHPDEISISGSEANDALCYYRSSIRRYEIMLRAITLELKEAGTTDSLYHAKLISKQDSIYGIMKNASIDFINQNPSNLASAFLATSIVNDSTPKPQIESVIKKLDPNMPDNAFVRKLRRKLNSAQ